VCWVSFCRVSLCRVSLYRVLLCRVYVRRVALSKTHNPEKDRQTYAARRLQYSSSLWLFMRHLKNFCIIGDNVRNVSMTSQRGNASCRQICKFSFFKFFFLSFFNLQLIVRTMDSWPKGKGSVQLTSSIS